MVAHGVMFHHFSDSLHPSIQGSISQIEFERILNYLMENFNVLQARIWYEKATKDQLQEGDICLTFDDNLRCQYDVALPILEKFDLTAFWFIYTSPLDNVIEKLELYRYFRNVKFGEIDAFYKEFYKKVSNSEYNMEVNKALVDFDMENYLIESTFYSDEDKRFRYIRDYVLGEERYNIIMNQMIEESDLDTKLLLNKLWMDRDCLLNLDRKEHIIGLHSHTHPTDIGMSSPETIREEYTMNFQKLKNILKKDIFTMSHPSNSYNTSTLDILRNLNIKLGFRANMTLEKHSQFEYPRMDHAFLTKKVLS
jgi:peptidoglycan/xylan/chitin deacetylase (PgdA/CDA1 family)